ncbi:hypothetical protein D4R51_01960 [bacterium]|nr:MAG: hypothetical protein D4R51_01960 [bacterium]
MPIGTGNTCEPPKYQIRYNWMAKEEKARAKNPNFSLVKRNQPVVKRHDNKNVEPKTWTKLLPKSSLERSRFAPVMITTSRFGSQKFFIFFLLEIWAGTSKNCLN